MPSRYSKVPKIEKGKAIGTTRFSSRMFFAAEQGALKCQVRDTRGAERLDTIAADTYGDAQYWWVIAAASGIGWCLQVPPGTKLRIPSSLGDALKYTGR
jgi:nucleoid-associated protein YgaU